MRIKMRETFQEVGTTAVLADDGLQVSILEAGETYIVDDVLGAYLLEHRKGESPEASPHYGAQSEPEFRYDDEKYAEMTQQPGLSIAEIYKLCEEAGVMPDSLELQGEHPTLKQVRTAIKAAKKTAAKQ
jgi:hypothetical protein